MTAYERICQQWEPCTAPTRDQIIERLSAELEGEKIRSERRHKWAQSLAATLDQANTELEAERERIRNAPHTKDCQFEIAKRCDEWLLAQMDADNKACNCWKSHTVVAENTTSPLSRGEANRLIKCYDAQRARIAELEIQLATVICERQAKLAEVQRLTEENADLTTYNDALSVARDELCDALKMRVAELDTAKRERGNKQ